jgi:ArsR family transcriptional regulator
LPFIISQGQKYRLPVKVPNFYNFDGLDWNKVAMRLKNFNLLLGSQIFKACADESRLRILNLIFTNGEMCITDLEKILEYTQAKTSRHLIYLKNAGILSYRRYNHWVFYQIKDEVYEIIKQIFQFLRKDQQLQSDQQLYQTLFSNRELAINKMQRDEWQKPT